jgi:hypothetical protein
MILHFLMFHLVQHFLMFRPVPALPLTLRAHYFLMIRWHLLDLTIQHFLMFRRSAAHHSVPLDPALPLDPDDPLAPVRPDDQHFLMFRRLLLRSRRSR